MRNRLKNTRVYLVGAMDRVADGGEQWRQRIQAELADLGIVFMDPTNKPINIGQESSETRQRRHEEKLKGNYDYVIAEMKPIRRVDLRMVDLADFLIVFLDKDNSGFGTVEELSLANRQKKPVLVVQEGGKENAPDWLFGLLPSSMIFGSWLDLLAYVRHIAHDNKIETLGRWYFFDWTGEGNDKERATDWLFNLLPGIVGRWWDFSPILIPSLPSPVKSE